jgi:hypothetical protein
MKRKGEKAARSNFDRNAITACQAQTDQTPIAPVWNLLKLAQKKKVALVVSKILVDIGDQKSDLSGGSAVKRFKVPNPMYFTP